MTPPGLSIIAVRTPLYQYVKYVSRHSSHFVPTPGPAQNHSSVQAEHAPNAGKSPDTVPRILNHTSPLDLLRSETNTPLPCKISDGILGELGASLDMSLFHSQSNYPDRPEYRHLKNGALSNQSSNSIRRMSQERVNKRTPSRTDRSLSSDRKPTLNNIPANCKDRWDPSKKLMRTAMDRIRFLYKQDPKTFSVAALSKAYGIGYESVKRILRSKYVPSSARAKEMDERRELVKATWRRFRHLRDVNESAGSIRNDKNVALDSVVRRNSDGVREEKVGTHPCSLPKPAAIKDSQAKQSTPVGVRNHVKNRAIQSDKSGDEWGWLK